MEKIDKGSNFKMQFLIIGIYLALTMSGLILMKLGGNTGSFAMENGNINFGISPISLIGFICYIGSFFVYTRMVVMFDLSYITPLCTGIVQILTLIASKVVFKENISIQGIIGASIIILGLIIMNWRKV
ncbi:MAG: hypothetical protein IKF97_05945 [Clostridia bacterium]|nr:hypothetical protein [Clostridia bacterium]MBR3255728.1 hypothetical protein [Clostridia bacterium]